MPTDLASPAVRTTRFGQYLVDRRFLAEEQLLDLLADSWSRRARLGDVLAARGWLSRGDVERLADEYHAWKSGSPRAPSQGG